MVWFEKTIGRRFWEAFQRFGLDVPETDWEEGDVFDSLQRRYRENRDTGDSCWFAEMRIKAQGAVSVWDSGELEKKQNVLRADFRAVPVCVPRAEKILFMMMVLVFYVY